MSPATPQLPGDKTPSAVAIIPARIGSTRLARKMLLRETGQYLFEHTARNLMDGGAVERVLIATDSDEILRAAQDVGLEAVMTSVDHRSGTDRVREAYELMSAPGKATCDVIVNVQGDEPDLHAADLRALIQTFVAAEVEMATLWAPITDVEELNRTSVVKVVLDACGDALYFSRAPIPNASHARARGADNSLEAHSSRAHLGQRHVGVYAFRPAALARFCELAESELERLENLEQLRWLEAGGRMRVVEATQRPLGIDTLEDYRNFVARHASLLSNSQET